MAVSNASKRAGTAAAGVGFDGQLRWTGVGEPEECTASHRVRDREWWIAATTNVFYPPARLICKVRLPTRSLVVWIRQGRPGARARFSLDPGEVRGEQGCDR